MKKLAALLCFLSTTSIAATGTATSTVKIVPGLTITQIQELDFGTFSCTGQNNWNFGYCGSILLNQSGADYEGNVTQIGVPTLPSFKVTGEYNASISISLGTVGRNSVSFNLKKTGSRDLEVISLVLASTSGILSANEGNGLGSHTPNFLSTLLDIPLNPDPGTYTGSYNIIVNYQ